MRTPPTCARCSRGPTRTCSPRRPGCSGCWACTRARTSPRRPPPAWPGPPLAEARRLLRELTRCHLLAEPAPGRYAFHDLLRAYAAEQAAALDSDDDRRAATGRMLDHYLHTAHAAARRSTAARGSLDLRPASAGHGAGAPRRPRAGAGLVRGRAPGPARRRHAGRRGRLRRARLAAALDPRRLPAVPGPVGTTLAAIQHTALAAAAAARRRRRPGQRAPLLGRACSRPALLGRRPRPPVRGPRAVPGLGDRVGQARLSHQPRQGDGTPWAARARRSATPAQALALFERGRQPARAGPRPEQRRLVPRPARRSPAGAAAQQAGPRPAAGTRRPLRRGQHLGHARLLPPPPRPARQGGQLLPAGHQHVRGDGLRSGEAEVLIHLGDARSAVGSRRAAIAVWREALEIWTSCRRPRRGPASAPAEPGDGAGQFASATRSRAQPGAEAAPWPVRIIGG